MKNRFGIGYDFCIFSNQSPSPHDQATAKALAGERPPPFGLLIVTPVSLYGLMHMD